MGFIKEQIESNFSAQGHPLKVYCQKGDLNKGLQKIIQDNQIEVPSILEFARTAPPLSLDIFALVTDGSHFEMLIIEVKLLNSVGLSELSQLIGYCIVSNSQYGLLINIDGFESSRLTDIIVNEPDVTHIVRSLDGWTKRVDHRIGVMQWDSCTKNITYSGHGFIKSIPKLCEELLARFDKT